MQPRSTLVLSLCATLLVVAGCTKPTAPDPDRPPEPKAAGQSAAARALHAPLDKARAVDAASRQAADAQRQAIEAAGG